MEGKKIKKALNFFSDLEFDFSKHRSKKRDFYIRRQLARGFPLLNVSNKQMSKMAGERKFWDYSMEEGVCPERIRKMISKAYPNTDQN